MFKKTTYGIAFTAFTIFLLISGLHGQSPKIHSHNDYEQSVPFWKAYAAGVQSIEVDVHLENDELLVGHDRKDLSPDRTLGRLYLKPISEILSSQADSLKLQLLIDIKSGAYPTMEALVRVLKQYPNIIQNKDVHIVISGNRPELSRYVDYPNYIHFDHQSLQTPEDRAVLDKIAMVSLNFGLYTTWNGKGRLVASDKEKISTIIAEAHKMGKPFRFWAVPDSKTAWKAMHDLGVDFINTDMPFRCVDYVSSLSQRVYANNEAVAVYTPTYDNDGSTSTPKNVVLYLGDGNGLAQISAATFANGGELTLTQLKHIGLVKTQSADDFTTDSAAGATAMATGVKVPNRAIGVNNKGESLPNLVEVLARRGYYTAIITTDAITGATPASFYAHQSDRDMEMEIAEDLNASAIRLFVSAPSRTLSMIGKNFQLLKSFQEINGVGQGKWAFTFPKGKGPAPLAMAVEHVLDYLDASGKPFFLLVEGAKIDSFGHENQIAPLIKESLAFDSAVAKGLAYADHSRETLVLVTADHETGGLTLPQGSTAHKRIEADFTTDDHTGIMVPLFAYGPKAHYFQGVYGNDHIYHKLLSALQIEDSKK